MLYPLSYAGATHSQIGNPSRRIVANAPTRVYVVTRAHSMVSIDRRGLERSLLPSGGDGWFRLGRGPFVPIGPRPTWDHRTS